MDELLIYKVAIPLLAVIFLLLIWNEIYKRGDKVHVKMVDEYRWNRCLPHEGQGIVILKIEIIGKKNKRVTIKDSELQVLTSFSLPTPTDHIPTILRIDDNQFEDEDFLFSKSELLFNEKGEKKVGLDVFLLEVIPGKGKSMDVEYSWYDEKWRRFSKRFRIYLDRNEHNIVL